MRAVASDKACMTDPNLLLRAAFTQHQAGDLPAACDLYRQVLTYRPVDHDALHLLVWPAPRWAKRPRAWR